ncbi:protein phosphatase 1 regulatory subunit 36 isoform X2 [Ascaphus truei]|uniref:protein phosphatase 1 regulatory subunit 36 isoform X2 n=1 Tax=Ascaphus truei TaxID=8439 RepID=UPI003F59B1B3
MDPITKPTPGLWYWKEDTKTLEFARIGPSHFRTVTAAKSPERGFSGKLLKSPRQANAALNLLQDHERLYITSFLRAVRSPRLDEFLMALLYYLSSYLEKNTLEKKPMCLMSTPGVLEQKEMADVSTRTEVALKHFAHTYCTLVLGEGMIDQHHMACGTAKSKGSATKKDRRFYESLYSFSIYIAWVVFRRKELSLIQEEVGRLLRSNTFNPALRLQGAPGEPGRELSVGKKKSKKTTTYAENRRENSKRPAIKSIITQRSPALVSLMPSPKERAQYLFHQHALHPSNSSELLVPQNWLEMSPLLFTYRVGILGEPLKWFHTFNLIPIGGEDDEAPGVRDKKSTASFYSHGHSPHHSQPLPGTGRQSAVISRATTEASYSDIE